MSSDNTDTLVNLLVAECRQAWKHAEVVTAENNELRKQVEALRPVELIVQRNERSQQQLVEVGKQLIEEQKRNARYAADMQRIYQRALDETSCTLSVALYKEFEKHANQPRLLDNALDAIEEMRMTLYKTTAKVPLLNYE